MFNIYCTATALCSFLCPWSVLSSNEFWFMTLFLCCLERSSSCLLTALDKPPRLYRHRRRLRGPETEAAGASATLRVRGV